MTSDNVKSILMIGVAAGAIYYVYQTKKIAVEVVTKKINPASHENIIFAALPQDGFIKQGGLDPVFKFFGL